MSSKLSRALALVEYTPRSVHSTFGPAVAMDPVVGDGLTAEPCETAIKGWSVSGYSGVICMYKYRIPVGRFRRFVETNSVTLPKKKTHASRLHQTHRTCWVALKKRKCM